MCLDVWLRLYRHAEEIREHALSSMPSSPAQLTQLKRGISTLAASQVETVLARNSVIDPIYRVALLTSTETWSAREAMKGRGYSALTIVAPVAFKSESPAWSVSLAMEVSPARSSSRSRHADCPIHVWVMTGICCSHPREPAV